MPFTTFDIITDKLFKETLLKLYAVDNISNEIIYKNKNYLFLTHKHAHF